MDATYYTVSDEVFLNALITLALSVAADGCLDGGQVVGRFCPVD